MFIRKLPAGRVLISTSTFRNVNAQLRSQTNASLLRKFVKQDAVKREVALAECFSALDEAYRLVGVLGRDMPFDPYHYVKGEWC